MRPFKPFLSLKIPFKWNNELKYIFEKSKAAIIDAIKHNVKMYDPRKPMCLPPDRSNLGLGYYLTKNTVNALFTF